MSNDTIRQKLATLPEQPGVYLMLDKDGEVIYVGKALVLRNRVKSYFTGTPTDNKTMHLVANIHDFDYIITNSEQESFLLESTLVKKHQPRYNILLKDDKRFPYIKIDPRQPFPVIEVTRELVKDGSQYYGPYTDVKYMKQLLRDLEWIFPHRTCNKVIPADRVVTSRACINHQLGKCPAPCIGKITVDEYASLMHKITKYILGKNAELIRDLKAEMEACAERLEFEKAGKIRDMIGYIDVMSKRQVVYFADMENRDIIAYYREESHIGVTVLKMLNGKINAKEVYSLKNTPEDSVEAILRAFLLQYYTNLDELPFQILLQIEPEDFDTLNNIFHKRLRVPARGEYKNLIEIARKNAFDFVEKQKLSYLRKSTRTIVPIQELKEHLNLKKLPRKMVCVDISTLQGSETVSSLVFFENGKPLKKHYRHFIIKTVTGQDDFASIAETLARYLSHFGSEEVGWELPDLIIIDGGKGQLSSAHRILEEHKQHNERLASVELVSLAKRIEEVFVVGQSESIIIPKNSPALKVMTNIRDEAHRFAITHHRKRRDSRTLSSELDAIKGLGEDKKFALLKHFGSVANIRAASKEELMAVKGIGERLAEEVLGELGMRNEE